MLPPKYKLSGTNDCAHKCHKIPRKAAINSLLSNALKRMYASELSIIANWLENLQKKIRSFVGNLRSFVGNLRPFDFHIFQVLLKGFHMPPYALMSKHF